jgi:hypothetical protein
MKKLILYSLLLIFSCSGEELNKVKTDLEIEGLKGDVKTTELYVYDALERFGEVVADSSTLNRYIKSEFNESGFITLNERVFYNNKENYAEDKTYDMYGKSILSYDSNNLVVEEEVNAFRTDRDDDYNFLARYNYEYDSSNKPKYTYSVDSYNDKTVKSFIYNEDGKLTEVKLNKLKEVLGEEEIGDLIKLTKHSYKENKEIIENYKGDGSFADATINYFEDGELTESHYYGDNKEEVRFINYYKDEKVFKYDSYYEGVLSYNYKYEYEYDSLGNPIKKITYSKDADEQTFKPDSVICWKIEYY